MTGRSGIRGAERPRPGTLLVRAALLASVWWAIAEDRPIAWGFVVVGVAAALGVTLVLRTRTAWRPGGVGRFVPFFLAQSLRGGVDVALRALLPGRRIRPGFVRHRCWLPDEEARIFLAKVLSLLPGTLSCELDGRTLTIHLLDTASEAARSPGVVERRVGAIFGLVPDPAGGREP